MTASVSLRRTRPDDAAFIAEMVAEAVSWDRPSGSLPPAVEEIVGESRVADYFESWPRPGDDGFVAEVDGQPVGACWLRRFSPDHPGYGFLGEDVPGVGLALREGFRGQGIGTSLLAATIEQARRSGAPGLSLSVADGNRARRLYERAGFEPVELDGGGSWTMRLTLEADPDHGVKAAGLSVRAATRQDGPAIVALMREMAEYFGEQSSATAASVAAMLADDTCGALVAEAGGEIAGTVGWYLYRSLFNARRSAVIEDLSVTAARRDEGIGRALLSEAIARLREADVAQVLIAAAVHNERARHLYYSLGFVEDDLLMLLEPEH